jgi:hypothetical protein
MEDDDILMALQYEPCTLPDVPPNSLDFQAVDDKFEAMSDEELEDAVDNASPEDKKPSDFASGPKDEWEERMQEDYESGGPIKKLAEEAREDHQDGNTEPLPGTDSPDGEEYYPKDISGEKDFLFHSSVNSAAIEMRESLFNRLKLYVEGYLADINYRMTSERKLGDPMPDGREKRGALGVKTLHVLARSQRRRKPEAPGEGPFYRHTRRGEDPMEIPEEEMRQTLQEEREARERSAREYEELARIYKQLTGDRFENPYWDRYEGPNVTEGNPLEYDQDRDIDPEKDRKMGRKASRFEKVLRDRREMMTERLFALRHKMTYD